MRLPDTMCGVVLTGYGGLDMLEYRTDLPMPVPGPDDVLIAVSACGLNNTDVNTRTGWYSSRVTGATGAETTSFHSDGAWGGGLVFPRIQGADPVGVVVDAGDDVDRALVGRRVLVDGWIRDPGGDLAKARYLGSERDGGFAEYLAVPSVNVYPVDSDFSDVELATFPCSYATAEHMLHRAGVSGDEWVLVSGASGGVGGALLQLARRRGAKTVALTSGEKLSQVAEIGADVVLARESDQLVEALLELTGGAVDVFADVVGGPMFPRLLETIRPGGHYVTSGAIAGPIVALDLRTLYLRDLTMHGATVLPPRVFANLVSYIERGEIRPIVAATYPLAELRQAQERFMRKEHVGAIVVEVAGSSPTGMVE